MKENYSKALRNSHEMLQNLGSPPASKEERYDLVTRIEKILHLSGEMNSEISEIRELYIARGLSALSQTESNPL